MGMYYLIQNLCEPCSNASSFGQQCLRAASFANIDFLPYGQNQQKTMYGSRGVRQSRRKTEEEQRMRNLVLSWLNWSLHRWINKEIVLVTGKGAG